MILCIECEVCRQVKYTSNNVVVNLLQNNFFAALDAYCLLEIYNLFKERCKACSIPFDEVCHKISSNHYTDTTKPKPKNKKHKHVNNRQ